MASKSKLSRSRESGDRPSAEASPMSRAKAAKGGRVIRQHGFTPCPTCGSSSPPKQRYFDEKWLATRWGVSVKKLQADRGKGVGVKFTKLGDAVRYRLRDVIAYEKLHTQTNTINSPSKQRSRF